MRILDIAVQLIEAFAGTVHPVWVIDLHSDEDCRPLQQPPTLMRNTLSIRSQVESNIVIRVSALWKQSLDIQCSTVYHRGVIVGSEFFWMACSHTLTGIPKNIASSDSSLHLSRFTDLRFANSAVRSFGAPLRFFEGVL